MRKRRIPWWLWPNLLSLDAPLVAVAWLWMFARLWYVKYQDPPIYWILGGLVWSIYVLDRIRDARVGSRELRERHRFHWQHRKLLRIIVGCVFLSCVITFFLGVPTAMLWDWPRGLEGPSLLGFFSALMTHGVVVLLFVGGFYLVGSRRSETIDGVLLKNTVTALTFSFGTAMGAHFYIFEGAFKMILSFEALGFAFLCLMNLNAIDLWEREERLKQDLPVRDFVLLLPLLVIGFFSLLAALFWHEYQKPFYYSMLFVSAALLMLDHFRSFLSARLLRVLADVALLLPLPIFWFWFV